MTTKEYLIAKNAIVKRVTGLTLVPEDQIVDTPKVVLTSDKEDDGKLHSGICPYCILYISNDCVECPMTKANNRCMGWPIRASYKGTWYAANEKWIDKSTQKNTNELTDLAIAYNN